MPAHRLILENAPKAGEWSLQWDSDFFSLKAPDGTLIFQVPTSRSHRLVEVHELDAEGKISFATAAGTLTFKPDKAAARDVRELLLLGLRSDTAYRAAQKRLATLMIPVGIAMFLVCGGLFALYCWWASLGDPPKDSAAYEFLVYFGWLIHLLLLVLLGFALAGPWVAFTQLRQLLRIRQAERSLPPPDHRLS